MAKSKKIDKQSKRLREAVDIYVSCQQNGTFNYEALKRQVESLHGYLPEKDYQNLIKLLETLK